MAADDYDVGSGSLHLRDDDTGFLDDPVEVEFSLDAVAVPQHATGCYEADQSHRQPAVVRLHALEDVWGEGALPGHGIVDIGTEERETKLPLPGAKQRDAV